jgi:uncharacterized protein (TIGR02391 family)
MEFSHKCGPCSGTGYYGANSKDICKTCSGLGVLRFEGQPSDYVSCKPCAGTGYHGINAKDTCSVCNGLTLLHKTKAIRIVAPQQNDSAIAFWDLIHPTIIRVAQGRFNAGNYADSVEAALKEVNTIIKSRVKTLTGIELDGADLMYKAFSPKNPIIKIDDLNTVSGSNMQQGYMQLFAGSMIGIRNPKAHENVVIEKARAIHFLFLASLLMHKLDEAQKYNN